MAGEVSKAYEIKDYLEMAASIATFLGIPIAIGAYIKAKRKEREEREKEWKAREQERERREYAIYDELDNKYIEYLMLCFRHPELGINEGVDPDTANFGETEKRQRDIVFEILLCTMERAHVMYSPKPDQYRSAAREAQWIGWKKYISYWMADKSFVRFWGDDKEFHDQFDENFVAYLNRVRLESPITGTAP